MRWFSMVLGFLLVMLVLVLVAATWDAPVAHGMTPRLRDYRVCGLAQLMGVVGHGTWVLTSEPRIPDGAIAVDQWIDQDGCVVVELYDSSFDLVPEGQDPPQVSWGWRGLAPGTLGYRGALVQGAREGARWLLPAPVPLPPVVPVPTGTPPAKAWPR